MPKDLHAEIIADLAATLNAWLAERGNHPPVALAPPTREGAGDLALPCHPYARTLRLSPQVIATQLAEVARTHPLVAAAEPVAGFLNLRFDGAALARRALPWALTDDAALGRSDALDGRRILVEYCSPNTNKPLHLGHTRNIVLGSTVAALARAAGAEVVQINLINDRGVHICKSMLAYQRFGEGATPESVGRKSDHYVGDLYVRFEKAFAEEFKTHGEPRGIEKDTYFNTESPLGAEVRRMLQAWEAGDAEVRALWRTMNGWCESGFEATYGRMGVRFDQVDRESQTYLLGKDLIAAGLEREVFERDPSGAVVFDLSRIGLEGKKAVLRSDGTSVYTTQDLGTAVQRLDQHGFDRMIYVVGNEQDHHFQVLFGILEHLRPEVKGRLFHMSYGMVELPDGKMKSREGKVVDADNLMDDLHALAYAAARERNPDMDDAEVHRRAEAIALGGLKFFLLKFGPATGFVFDKERSIALEGETGAYCQYAYARAGSILRKLAAAGEPTASPDYGALTLPQEQAVIHALMAFPGEVRTAALELKPNLLTKAVFEIARAFAAFFNSAEARVIGAEPAIAAARADLVRAARRSLEAGLHLLGMTPLEEM
ncbi:arginine--tRNA ligase [Myxococcota bacterium]|nr:arginine--tRNA ligase [Myxococcota bacterium]